VATGWTQDRKAKQRAAIYRWRPWEKSTGPKTPAGKAAVSKNATKHGQRAASAIAERRSIRAFLSSLTGKGLYD
jgi:hypothetical protein